MLAIFDILTQTENRRAVNVSFLPIPWFSSSSEPPFLRRTRAVLFSCLIELSEKAKQQHQGLQREYLRSHGLNAERRKVHTLGWWVFYKLLGIDCLKLFFCSFIHPSSQLPPCFLFWCTCGMKHGCLLIEVYLSKCVLFFHPKVSHFFPQNKSYLSLVFLLWQLWDSSSGKPNTLNSVCETLEKLSALWVWR